MVENENLTAKTTPTVVAPLSSDTSLAPAASADSAKRLCRECGREVSSVVVIDRPIWPSICAACGEELHKIKAAIASQVEEERVRRTLLDSGFPLSVFDDMPRTWEGPYAAAKEIVEKFVDEDRGKPFLFVTGDVGCGKSTLGCIAGERAIRAGRSACYTIFSELLLRIRDSFRPTSMTSEFEVLRTVREARFLILDDVGTERATNFTAESLFNVVDFRYRNVGKTVLVSNYSPKQLANRLVAGDDRLTADRVVDRIVEFSTWLPLEGKSFRPQLAKSDRDFSWATRTSALDFGHAPEAAELRAIREWKRRKVGGAS